MAYDVEISERPLEAFFDIRGEAAAAAECLAVLDLLPPERPNTCTGQAEARAFWVGPKWWLLRAPLVREAELGARFTQIVAGRLASATLVSDFYAGFDVTGPDALAVLAQGCPLDLHPRRTRPGMASFTDVFGLAGLLYKLDERPAFSLYVERCDADYLGRWLRAAAVPSGRVKRPENP